MSDLESKSTLQTALDFADKAAAQELVAQGKPMELNNYTKEFTEKLTSSIPIELEALQKHLNKLSNSVNTVTKFTINDDGSVRAFQAINFLKKCEGLTPSDLEIEQLANRVAMIPSDMILGYLSVCNSIKLYTYTDTDPKSMLFTIPLVDINYLGNRELNIDKE